MRCFCIEEFQSLHIIQTLLFNLVTTRRHNNNHVKRYVERNKIHLKERKVRKEDIVAITTEKASHTYATTAA